MGWELMGVRGAGSHLPGGLQRPRHGSTHSAAAGAVAQREVEKIPDSRVFSLQGLFCHPLAQGSVLTSPVPTVSAPERWPGPGIAHPPITLLPWLSLLTSVPGMTGQGP